MSEGECTSPRLLGWAHRCCSRTGTTSQTRRWMS